jgi:hypothetical protein
MKLKLKMLTLKVIYATMEQAMQFRAFPSEEYYSTIRCHPSYGKKEQKYAASFI